MSLTPSVEFFDSQFQRQVREGNFALNPFEGAALPYLQGHVLDYGCGLGNLAVAAARQGCTVEALDASPAAIERLQHVASASGLPIEAAVADLRHHALAHEFDAVVSIGLLMFLDCATAVRQLAQLRSHVRPGGIAVVNVLIEGTTYLGMFDPLDHCLFARDALLEQFSGWEVLHSEFQNFDAPGGGVKAFATLIARKSIAAGAPEEARS